MEVQTKAVNTPVFKLQQFPHVCRLCLESESDHRAINMVPLDSVDDMLQGGTTIEEYIAKVSCEVPEGKAAFFPQKVCQPCLGMLQFYARYRSKMMHVYLLTDALVELKQGNTRPVVDLFRNQGETVQALVKDLALSEKEDPCVTDLIYEFKQYDGVTMQGEIEEDDSNVEMVQDQDNQTRIEVLEHLIIEPVFRKGIGRPPNEAGQADHSKEPAHKFPCKAYKCPEGFDDKDSHDKHFNETHKTFVCEICGFKFSQKARLVTHKQRHASERNFHCQYCRKTFKTKRDVGVHTREIHIHRTFNCEICGLEFKRKGALKYHELTHTNSFDHPCQMCGSKFKSDTALNCHVKKVHTERRYGCTECEKKFHSNHLLMDHIERMHGRQMRFFCDVCVEVFTSEQQLNVHLARHAAPGELECGTCLRVYGSREELAAHLCIEYRESYVCCAKDWRHHRFYNRHVFIEHGVKTNARVRMQPGQLFGKIRMARKGTEVCTQCQQVIKSSKREQHLETCVGIKTATL